MSAPPRGPAWGQPATDPSRSPARGADVVLPADAPILLDAVSRWYGNVVAVNDVSFDARARASPAPRSERRRQVDDPAHDRRVLAPSTGRVTLLGEPAWRHPAAIAASGSCPSARRSTAFSPGRSSSLLARLHGLPDPGAAAARPIALVELTSRRRPPDRDVFEGHAQRVKLAAALVHDPRSCCSTNRSTAWTRGSGCR